MKSIFQNQQIKRQMVAIRPVQRWKTILQRQAANWSQKGAAWPVRKQKAATIAFALVGISASIMVSVDALSVNGAGIPSSIRFHESRAMPKTVWDDRQVWRLILTKAGQTKGTDSLRRPDSISLHPALPTYSFRPDSNRRLATPFSSPLTIIP